ncbi:YitT family protein [Deltaproteobacteria bacterium OttesenSCG-928-K17]|nr:YitT family protein [Deltaproteobacteria bacterium OttesenSCG-928-K17]
MTKGAESVKKDFIVQSLYLIAGTLCYAAALRLFFVDNRIAAGGFSGIATVLNYVSSIPIGTIVFLMNCPLILIAIWIMGWRYCLKTIVSMVLYSVILNLAESITVVTQDRFAAAVFGGILYGVGAFFILQAKASAGGTDLVARLLLRRFKNISLGKMFLLIDGFCVVFAIIVYGDLESGVYALTAIVVFSYVTDKIISGFNVADLCYIITTSPPEEMCRDIMQSLHVGVTHQEGLGMYAQTKRHVLMVVVRPREIQRLKRIIQKHDPQAFLVVAWASEVMGGGFKVMSDQS